MRFNISLFLFLLWSSVYGQAEKIFPPLEGENLAHETINLPEDVNGKHTLIGLAFTKNSEKFLRSWFNPIYQQLIAQPEEGSLFAISYDVNVYFIPMLTGAKRPAYQKVMDKVERDVDPKLHPHVLFYKGTMKEYRDALAIEEKDLPYFYLLDPTGKIVYATSGLYTETKMQRIIDSLPF